MARSGPFKDLGWGKLGGNKKPNTPKKNPGQNNRYRTSAMGQLMGQAKEAATPRKATGGNYAAIVLRVDKEDLSAAAGSSWMTSWYEEILEVPLPETIKIKARIPALHAGIPEPDKYGCGTGSGKHQFWINMHPTFYASSQDIEEPECGDIVIVSVNADDGSGGGDAAGSGLIMKTVVIRENNPVKLGGSCPPNEQFPNSTPSTAEGANGDAMGGEEVSANPVPAFGLPADCDFECMMDFIGGIAAAPPSSPGRDANGEMTTFGSPLHSKGIFISRQSLESGRMPTPITAISRLLWADMGYVVIEAIHQTANRTYFTNRTRLKEYARMFALAGLNVYISGTPYPGKASKYVEYMTNVATDMPVLGMVMTPSWGYLSPGNKDKYARQAKYVTSQMKKAAYANKLQLGFSNSWMPSAEYTVADAAGEDGEVSIRYKDSFPYYCFSDVDWAISQILSTSGRSIVQVRESTGAVEIRSERGSEALKREDFAQVLNDYSLLGFKYIIPAFGVMGSGWDDYMSSSEKPPERMKDELDMLGAEEHPNRIGEYRDEETDPSHLPEPGLGYPGLSVSDWSTGYFGAIINCEPEEIDVDRRCPTPPAPAVIEDPPPAETVTELVEVPVMEWTDGWADYTIDGEGIISYLSPISGDMVYVQSDNTSNIYPGGCPEACYDAIMEWRPESSWVEETTTIYPEDIEATGDDATSQIWPTFPKPNPPIKSQVMWSTMWWDYLNAEENLPCWQSTRWQMMKDFHRYSPIAYERHAEGGAINPGTFEGFNHEIQKAMAGIEAHNRIAEQTPGMHKVSLEQYMMAVQQAQSMSTFADGSDMESFSQAASSVAQSAATELSYDGEGSASGDGSDTDSGLEDEIADEDAYYGSDSETAGGESGATAGGTSLDAYPPFPYIQLSSPVTGGNTGGYLPASPTAHSHNSRAPGSINRIVLHTTAGYSQLAGGEVFCREGYSRASTHYGINTGGFCYMFVQEKDVAWGNGGSEGNAGPPSSQGGRRNMAGGRDKFDTPENADSISIEITGMPSEEASQPGKWYTDVMYENLAFLCANICRRNSIAVNRENILGHDELSMRKSDPGTLLQGPYPDGIDYPYGGIDSSGTNMGPQGGEGYPGAGWQINSYSPNIQGKETFDWERFMGLVENFFAGLGVPMPPDVSQAVGSASVAGGAAQPGAGAPAEACNGAGLGAAGGAAGGGGSAGGAPLSAAQIAALGDFQGNWPSGGSPAFSSDFGPRSPPTTSGGQGSSNHPGIDTISVDPVSSGNPGTIPLFAVADGTVTRVRDMSDTAGKFVDVTHNDGMTSQYMHCHTIQVTNGQTVSAGDVVATMGTTGNSSGVHLHYSLWTGASYASEKVDPASALGLECNDLAKGHSRYGRLCAAGNQNMTPGGPYTGG